jgi:hypothetical protein
LKDDGIKKTLILYIISNKIIAIKRIKIKCNR